MTSPINSRMIRQQQRLGRQSDVVCAGGYAAYVSVRACTASGSTIDAPSTDGDIIETPIVPTSSSAASTYSDASRTEHTNAIFQCSCSAGTSHGATGCSSSTA